MAMQPIGREQQSVVVAAPEVGRSGMSRRSVLRVAFWSSVLALVGGIGATILNTLYRRDKGALAARWPSRWRTCRRRVTIPSA